MQIYVLGVGEKMTKYQVREEGRRIAMSITIMQHVPQRDDLIFALQHLQLSMDKLKKIPSEVGGPV